MKKIENWSFKGNEEFLNKNIPKIEKLIMQNPFSEKILNLLLNPSLASTPVMNLHNELSPPNCLGTVFWTANVSKLDYPYHAYETELEPHMRLEISAEERLLGAILGDKHKENMIPGAFNFSYSVYTDGWHSGIYLGRIDREEILFAQHGHGNPFGIETENCFDNPRYYIPRTLKK